MFRCRLLLSKLCETSWIVFAIDLTSGAFEINWQSGSSLVARSNLYIVRVNGGRRSIGVATLTRGIVEGCNHRRERIQPRFLPDAIHLNLVEMNSRSRAIGNLFSIFVPFGADAGDVARACTIGKSDKVDWNAKKKKKKKKKKTDIRDAAPSNNVNCCNFDCHGFTRFTRIEAKRIVFYFLYLVPSVYITLT